MQKVALIHYWLVAMRGGERVLEALCELYPQADIYTHAYDPSAIQGPIREHRIRTTFVDRLPMARRHYKKYLPLMPLALEQLDLREYDLVISSESGPAKGVLTRPGQVHLCYCHTPMRYAWDMHREYAEQSGAPMRLLAAPVMHYMRLWDVAAANRVDDFAANSRNVAGRIAKHYRRPARVIHPPVDVEAFAATGEADPDGPYLFVGQLVRYKRADLAIRACASLGRRLVVVGEGEDKRALERLAGPSVEFRGRLEGTELARAYRDCRALLFPGEEDFGIVPVEAMAAGRPVIAFGRGGALETVVEDESGLFFHEASAESLKEAILRFESMESRFDWKKIANHAKSFDKAVFRKQISEWAAASVPG
jgi:glycosyltransferase involved in cell wall biosynthesis